MAGAAIGAAGLAGGAVAIGSDHALLIVLGLAGLAVIAVLLAWPVLALPVAVFLIWTNTPTLAVDAGAPTVLAAVIPLILVAPLAASFLRRETLTIDRPFIWMLVLLGVFVLSTTFGAQPQIGGKHTMTFVTEGVVLYFLVFNAIRTPAALRHAWWAIVAAGTFLAAVTVFQNLTHTFDKPFFGFAPLDIAYALGKSDSPRAQGPVSDANYFAQILVATMALALPGLWREPKRSVRMLIGAGVTVMALALAFTYSRGGTLALMVVIGGLVFLGFMKLRHLAGVLVVVAVLVSVVPGYQDRIQTLTKLGGVNAQSGSSNEADDAARGRFTENLTAVLIFFDHPLLGVGPGSYGEYYQEYAARTGGEVHRASKHGEEAGQAPKREAHNLFLQMAAEIGIVGLVALCAVLWTAFGQLVRARRRWLRPDVGSNNIMVGLLLALLGYIAAGFFLTLAFERYLWLLLALLGGAAFVARDQASRQAPAQPLATITDNRHGTPSAG